MTPVCVSRLCRCVAALLLAVLHGFVLAEDDRELERLLQQDVLDATRIDTTVTSVGKRNQKLSETASAVYVITQEDIRRSGVTSIPEALRMVPGLQVAKLDSSGWAITARGFNGRFANKLLVLMDGREVYSPTYGGVYWEVQDTPLFDIDRIEVIRGPGATIWGANAVNGVINIITKDAGSTQGGRIKAGGGTVERGFGAFRYGGRLSEEIAGRVWAQGFSRSNFTNASGDTHDAWDMAETGFRLDRDTRLGNSFSLIGNAYSGSLDQELGSTLTTAPYFRFGRDRARVSGFNLLSRWKKSISASSEITVQGYYDHTHRAHPNLTEQRDTVDVEAQHRVLWGRRHDLTWGIRYRFTADRYLTETPDLGFRDAAAGKHLFSIHMQDEIELIPSKWTLTLGTKLQHNDFTGFEVQPSLRLSWQPYRWQTVWGAVSRAVRTPSRFDHDGRLVTSVFPPSTAANPSGLPAVAIVNGNPRLPAEELVAYEVGYRFKPRADFAVDLALFYNAYRSLRGVDFSRPSIREPTATTPYFIVDGILSDSHTAQSYGGELLVTWEARPWWQLELAYAYIDLQFQSARGPLAASPENGVTPHNQLSLRSALSVSPSLDLDLWFRFVDRVPYLGAGGQIIPPYLSSTAFPEYATMDARLAWRPIRGIELSVVGQNLLDSRHEELQQELLGPPRTSVPRGFYFAIDWRF